MAFFCFQSHRVLLMNEQEPVCHATQISIWVTVSELGLCPAHTAETNLWLHIRLCNPLPRRGPGIRQVTQI